MSTVSIPFQPMPHQMLFVTSRAAEKPDEARLMEQVLESVQALLDPSLAAELRAYVAAGGAKLTVMDATKANIRPFLEAARALDGQADPLQLDAVRWCVIIGAQGVMVPPVLHVWFCRVAASVLLQQSGDALIDAVNLLVDPRYSDTQMLKAACGNIHLSRHLRLMAPACKPGNARLRCLGMHDFGLPDLEIAACPTALLGAARLILLGTAQHLLRAAMAHAPQLGDEEATSVVTLELPEAFTLSRELLDEAMGEGAQGDIRSTPLRLRFVPGDARKFAMVEILAPKDLADAGDAWMEEAVARLTPAA